MLHLLIVVLCKPEDTGAMEWFLLWRW